MAGSRWEDLAIKKVMTVVEAAVDPVVDITVPDLIASRFTHGASSWSSTQLRTSVPCRPSFWYSGSVALAKAAQFQINNYRELPFRIYYVMATEDSDGVMQPESQLLEDLTDRGA